MSLRSSLIRIAKDNPSVRPHILPLLREASLPPALTWMESQLGKVFNAAKNGVAFVLDQNLVFSKPGTSEVSRALEQAIKDQYGEAHAMTSEYFEDARPGSKDYENIIRAGEQAARADKIRVSISQVTSPTSGKSGLKVVFRPMVEQVEAL